MELLTVTLATFTMLMFVLGLLPFRLTAKVMPIVVTAAAWGCMTLYGRWPHEIEAVAVAGGVAIVSRYAVSQLPDPWSLDDLLGRLIEMIPQRRPKRAGGHRTRPSRIPRL